MKKLIAYLACSAVLAVLTSPGLAQLQRVEDPAEPPEPVEAPEAPETAAVAMAHDVLTGIVSPGATASRALIIPKEAGDPKDFADAEEDLNVMARILEKAAAGREGKNRHAMGIWVNDGFSSSSMPKNLYIEGHGALFFLNVNFPLLPPATKSSEAETKEKTSTEWEDARRELYRPSGSGFDSFEFHLKNIPWVAGSAEAYDSEKVDDLKRDLIAALKNAAHMRNLKSDETVTVVVSGRGSGSADRLWRKAAAAGSGGGTGARAPVAIYKSAGGDARGTRLILRARKADVDAFQKDKLNLEEFRKKVSAIVY